MWHLPSLMMKNIKIVVELQLDVKSKYENMKLELQEFIESNDDEYDWCEKFISKW